MNLEKFYNEVNDGLLQARKVFLKDDFSDEEGDLRSVEEAQLILGALQEIALGASELFKSHPSLESIFEKDFGPYKELCEREAVVETCFLDDFLFPEVESFPFIDGEFVSKELIENYKLSFKDWVVEKTNFHLSTQKLVLENFDVELKTSNLDCRCNKCLADFRAKLREFIFKEQVQILNHAEEQLEDLILDQKISYLSDYVQKMRKKIDRNLHQHRYRLKRGSLNKLDSDVKSHFKSRFGQTSQLGKVYKERLVTYFNSILVDMDVKPDMISAQEYERFFTQLGVGIWKSPGALKREFQKVVKTVMSFKRKDISATILREYLGQFWLHSNARLKTREIHYHMGPTNSGKTYNAIQALSKSKHGCYLAPLRLLASELFDTLNELGVKTNLLTGEEVIEVPDATHYSSTIEMARLDEEFDCVVIDEIQMITDAQRGWAWTRALVNINSDQVHLCGDASVFELVEQIAKLTGDKVIVHNYERKTSLTVMKEKIRLTDLEKNDALIVFSRRNALKYKRDLENLNFKVSIVYGRLSPEVRREQARKFNENETDIMVSTDAIAMGMNLPVKRIVFSTLSKFYDSKEHPITVSEIKQIAGRAGRFNLFPEGHTTALEKVEDGLERLNEALHKELDQKEYAMVGPDLDIFRSVNSALEESNLPTLSLSEFLQLFNTMTFEKPFFCVDLKEMIDVAEMVENADERSVLTDAEIFGFACAPINLGLMDHVQYFVWILTHYVGKQNIINEEVDHNSDNIDYLETAIKCVELYQWLARHFDNNHFAFDEEKLLYNKSKAIEKLNDLLSEKVSKSCSSCGVKLDDTFQFNICESCFGRRRRGYHRRSRNSEKDGDKKDLKRGGRRGTRGGGKTSSDNKEKDENRRRSATKKPAGSGGSSGGKRKPTGGSYESFMSKSKKRTGGKKKSK